MAAFVDFDEWVHMLRENILGVNGSWIWIALSVSGHCRFRSGVARKAWVILKVQSVDEAINYAVDGALTELERTRCSICDKTISSFLSSNVSLSLLSSHIEEINFVFKRYQFWMTTIFTLKFHQNFTFYAGIMFPRTPVILLAIYIVPTEWMYVFSDFMLKKTNPRKAPSFMCIWSIMSQVINYIWVTVLQFQEQSKAKESKEVPKETSHRSQRKSKMPKQSAPVSRSVFTRNLASKRGSTWRPYVNDIHNKPRRPMRTRASKKDMKVVEHVFEDDIVVSPPPRGPRDLRFTIPDVPANRDLLSFLNTRAHDMMGEVVRELHTVTKIKVLLLLILNWEMNSSSRWLLNLATHGCISSLAVHAKHSNAFERTVTII